MKIYVASAIRHARMWIDIRSSYYPDITIVSSWIDFLKNGEPNATPEIIKESWDNNIKDIIICDLLILYVEKGDTLRGSCFESGVAFAMGKPVLYVGDPDLIGTMGCCFEYFPTLENCLETLEAAQEMKNLVTNSGTITRN